MHISALRYHGRIFAPYVLATHRALHGFCAHRCTRRPTPSGTSSPPLRRIRAHPVLPFGFEKAELQVGSHLHCMKLPESAFPKTSDETCSCDLYCRNSGGVNRRNCGIIHRNCGINHCKQPLFEPRTDVTWLCMIMLVMNDYVGVRAGLWLLTTTSDALS